jgi:hypothetical protein
MKLVNLLAGVAVAAMMTTAASADPIFKATTLTGLGTFTVTNPASLGGILAIANVNNPNSALSTAVVAGLSVGNTGTASLTDGETFTLKGKVTPDCTYYSGAPVSAIDFGTIGINASSLTGPNLAFDMVAPAAVSIQTNMAGCNTSNSVTLTKNNINGLVNSTNAGGYDTNVFQANLPYSAQASYVAAASGVVGAGAPVSWTVAENSIGGTATHGAWKSAMDINVVIPVPPKALLAGDYQGTLQVTLLAL